MRQTVHLNIATVAAALAMSCALPLATRASLDPDGRSVTPEMSTAAPLDFVGVPSGQVLFNADHQFDLSLFTPQGFLMLSKDLNRATGWSGIDRPLVVRKSNAKLASIHGHEDTLYPGYQTGTERIAFNKPTLAPAAFVRFCMQYPADCKAEPTDLGSAPVELTKARWAELAKVNRDVNSTIRPEANLGGVGAEEWLIAPRRGDCNDYAVTKRHELLARGWPVRSLLLTEVVVASGEHHLVLVVRTNEDDFVLDNLSATVRPVSQIEYQWVRAQQAENPRFWAMINVTRVDRVAMNSR